MMHAAVLRESSRTLLTKYSQNTHTRQKPVSRLSKASKSPISHQQTMTSLLPTKPDSVPLPYQVAEDLYHVSNHVLVNMERTKATIPLLSRNLALDELAHDHATEMAASLEVFRFSHSQGTIFENIMRGPSVSALHHAAMNLKGHPAREHILNPDFREFGMGTAKGSDGYLYVCQLFSV